MIDELDMINERSRTMQNDKRNEMLSILQSREIRDGFNKLQTLMEALKDPVVTVDNIDEIKKYLRDEFSTFVTKLQVAISTAVGKVSYEIKMPENIKIANYEQLMISLNNLSKLLKSKEFSPTIDVRVPDVIVPEIKIPKIELPVINVPEPSVTVSPQVNVELSELLKALKPLGFISNRATNPISVRLSDGEKFVKALKEVAQKSGQIVHAFANSAGMSVDEYRTTVRASDDILASYKCADVDADASPNYYGFVDKDGNWYILKETISAGADTYRYAKGGSGYDTAVTGAWATRASLTYGYFHNIF